MKVFVIRLCRFQKDNPRALVGLVEIVGKKGRIAFKTMDELWEILNSSERQLRKLRQSPRPHQIACHINGMQATGDVENKH